MPVKYEMGINDGTKITFGEEFDPQEVVTLLQNRETQWIVLGGHILNKHTILNTYKVETPDENAAE